MLRACGATAAVEARAATHLATAQAALSAIPAGPYRDLIAALVIYLDQRQT